MSNVVVTKSQQLLHLNSQIREEAGFSNMYGLPYTGYRLNMVNMEYHQSVAKCHPNLVLKFSYLKDPEDVDPFKISEVDGKKEVEQVKGEVYVTSLITYK